jgi:hypothetical protein
MRIDTELLDDIGEVIALAKQVQREMALQARDTDTGKYEDAAFAVIGDFEDENGRAACSFEEIEERAFARNKGRW